MEYVESNLFRPQKSLQSFACLRNASKSFFFYKSGKIYMKDEEYAETNEKSIFKFLVFEIWSFFVPEIGNFR